MVDRRWLLAFDQTIKLPVILLCFCFCTFQIRTRSLCNGNWRIQSLGASWLLFCRDLEKTLVVFRNSDLLAFYASRPVRILGPLLASDRNRSPPS
jgi:hypothetical protein